MLKSRNNVEFGGLEEISPGLAALAVRIPPAQQTRRLALSSLLVNEALWDIPRIPTHTSGADERQVIIKAVKDTCKSLNPGELCDALKWPFCVGEARKLVLAELENKLNPPEKFDGDVWKFVEQATKLGFDLKFLNNPAKRPRFEDAIAELKSFQTDPTKIYKP